MKQHILSRIVSRHEAREYPLVMGILNVTPDSFSDGNHYLNPEKALAHALQMAAEGAELIDIGGESTRPGSLGVSAETELKRVLPVIQAIRAVSSIPISLDTSKAEVARKGLEAGVSMINDISALRSDPGMADVLAGYPETAVVLMHMQGTPDVMQKSPYYKHVIEELMIFFEERIQYGIKHGIARERIIVDPGIGFGKRLEDNCRILSELGQFRSLGVPILLGSSRKSFINMIDPSSPEHRLGGTIATSIQACRTGVDIIRVHDIQPNLQAMKVFSRFEARR